MLRSYTPPPSPIMNNVHVYVLTNGNILAKIKICINTKIFTDINENIKNFFYLAPAYSVMQREINKENVLGNIVDKQRN